MRKFSLILIIFLLSACGVWFYRYVNNPERDQSYDERIVPLLDEWKSQLDSANIQYESALKRVDFIKVMDDYPNCGKSDLGKRTITLNLNCLNEGLYSARLLLWHELGHSVFQLKHKTGTIMNREPLDEEYIRDNWEYFKQEYINQCKKRNNGF